MNSRTPKLLLSNVDVAWNRQGNHDKIYGAAEVIILEPNPAQLVPTHETTPCVCAFNFYASRAEFRTKTLAALHYDAATHDVMVPIQRGNGTALEGQQVSLNTIGTLWRGCEALAYDLYSMRKAAQVWFGNDMPETLDTAPFSKACEVLEKKCTYKGYSYEVSEGQEVSMRVELWRREYMDKIAQFSAGIEGYARLIPERVLRLGQTLVMQHEHPDTPFPELMQMANEDEFARLCEMQTPREPQPARRFSKRRSIEL